MFRGRISLRGLMQAGWVGDIIPVIHLRIVFLLNGRGTDQLIADFFVRERLPARGRTFYEVF